MEFSPIAKCIIDGLAADYAALGYQTYLNHQRGSLDIYNCDFYNLRYFIVSVDTRMNQITLCSITKSAPTLNDTYDLADPHVFQSIQTKIRSYEPH